MLVLRTYIFMYFLSVKRRGDHHKLSVEEDGVMRFSYVIDCNCYYLFLFFSFIFTIFLAILHEHPITIKLPLLYQ